MTLFALSLARACVLRGLLEAGSALSSQTFFHAEPTFTWFSVRVMPFLLQ